jgi:aspartyl-tRNA(Asn)/glutamyl-tRNA(Gln) amidotransferase subunit C
VVLAGRRGAVATARKAAENMAIDRDTVRATAQLARLALSDDEMSRLQDQLSTILGHIAVLQEADTSEVPATASVLPLQNVLSEDHPRPSEPPDTLLENAPSREDDYLRVRAVLEE